MIIPMNFQPHYDRIEYSIEAMSDFDKIHCEQYTNDRVCRQLKSDRYENEYCWNIFGVRAYSCSMMCVSHKI